MPDAYSVLLQRLQAAFDTVMPGADPVLRASERADFQANGALALSKELGRAPRDVAEEVVAAAVLDDVCAAVEISGPGFINLTLADGFVSDQLAAMGADDADQLGQKTGVNRLRRVEFASLDRSLEAADMPRDLSGIQSQLLGNDRCFGIPLLNVKGQIHQHGAITLHNFETLQSANQGPDLRGIQV